MTIEVLNEGTRRAAKTHQCFHCYRPIRKGEVHRFQTCKYDCIYTLRMHEDCDRATDFYIRTTGLRVSDFDFEGFPPLRDMIFDNGEYQGDLDRLRGHFPHVVCRMEFIDQMGGE